MRLQNLQQNANLFLREPLVVFSFFVQIEELQFERVAFVPEEEDSRSKNPEYSGDDEQLADGRDADTEDENRRKSEKQSDRAFDRNSINPNATVIPDFIGPWAIHKNSSFQNRLGTLRKSQEKVNRADNLPPVPDSGSEDPATGDDDGSEYFGQVA
jgi:hypothetical protein